MQWTIYTKDYCPYCDLAKTLIKDLGYTYEEIDVTEDTDTLSKIVEQTHMRTVPQIFLGGTFIGGYTQLRSAVDRGDIVSSPSSQSIQDPK